MKGEGENAEKSMCTAEQNTEIALLYMYVDHINVVYVYIGEALDARNNM